MFSFMQNINIGKRIAITLVLPIIGLLLFSASVVYERYDKVTAIEKIQELANLAPFISNVIHELQKERGTSAVFISSKRNKFSSELSLQYKNTNAVIARLDEALKDFQAEKFSQQLVADMGTSRTALSRLKSTRSDVGDLNILVGQMADYYGQTIVKLLGMIEEMAVLSTEVSITKAIVAYTSFLHGKEQAGIERAMGGGGFGSGKFSPEVHRKFVELIAQQRTNRRIFDIYATDAQKSFWDETVRGQGVDDVNKMRKIAIASPYSDGLDGVEGSSWYNSITQKINLLKTVEDRLASDLIVLTDTIKNTAQSGYTIAGGITFIFLLVTGILVTTLVRGITHPIRDIAAVMNVLSTGDVSVEVTGTDRRDEIGSMAKTVQIFRENIIERERMQEQQIQSEQIAREEKHTLMTKMADEFEGSVGGIVQSVSSASTQMRASAETLSTTAEETSARSEAASMAADGATTNVHTVAAAAEELSISISEIGRQMNESTKITIEAVREADHANELINGLADEAIKVGKVVAMITDIADQTNLLALNATIEAARAGEAGKGFAVVASEVKNLAHQTSKATDEIGGQIKSIQEATRNAVSAIQGISLTITKVNEIAATISASVEEQGAATQEIARNVEQAAAGTSEVSSNFIGVSEAATETGALSSQLLNAANELWRQAESLSTEVKKFLGQVRSA